MSLAPRLPLALRQLTDSHVKTAAAAAAAAAGICFSTVLVFFSWVFWMQFIRARHVRILY